MPTGRPVGRPRGLRPRTTQQKAPGWRTQKLKGLRRTNALLVSQQGVSDRQTIRLAQRAEELSLATRLKPEQARAHVARLHPALLIGRDRFIQFLDTLALEGVRPRELKSEYLSVGTLAELITLGNRNPFLRYPTFFKPEMRVRYAKEGHTYIGSVVSAKNGKVTVRMIEEELPNDGLRVGGNILETRHTTLFSRKIITAALTDPALTRGK